MICFVNEDHEGGGEHRLQAELANLRNFAGLADFYLKIVDNRYTDFHLNDNKIIE